MTAPKHTPGPWEIINHPAETDGPYVQGPTGTNDAHIVARIYGPDAKANARLIAAAPELLEACEYVARIECPHVYTSTCDLCRVRNRVVVVIAKARGEL